MNTYFFGYRGLEPKTLERLISTAILAFDTNFILNLFRFEKRHSDVLFSILSRSEINNRIFIPHQVAIEFYENVDEVSEEPFARFDEISSQIKSFKKGIDNSSKIKNIDTIYGSLKKRIDKNIDEILKAIEDEKRSLKKDFNKERILAKLESILEGKIGVGFKISELDSILSVAEFRYLNKVPPGFGQDEKKPGAYSFAGMVLPKKYGDFFIWEQILINGASAGKPTVFVTDDEKADWIRKGDARPIPRPELRIEAMSRTNNDFYIIKTREFVSLVNKIFHADVNDEQIQEIGELSNRQGNWKEEVYRALVELGGSADLKDIYRQVVGNRKGNVPDSVESIIRKSIYHYSSDADIFLGKDDLYKQVSAGKWMIRQVKIN